MGAAARVVGALGLVWLLAAMGPAPSFLENVRNVRELRFVHALAWAHLFGVDCRWCVREAASLNAASPSAFVAPEAVAEVAFADIRAAARRSTPFVVRGALARTPWTAADLDAVGGSYAFQCAANVSETLRDGGEFAGYGCAASLPLGDGLRRGHYLRQNARVLRNFPALAESAGLTEAFLGTLPGGPFTVRGLFAGDWDGEDPASPGRGSSLHCDLSSNWYAQRAGEKTWTLLDPALSARLLPAFDGRRGVPALFSGLGYGAAPVAGAAPLSAFPRVETTLRVGDLLFVPSWWWHEIENGAGLSAAVAVRGPRSVAAAFLPPSFATVGSARDVAALAAALARRALGGGGSFEDAFLPNATAEAPDL